MQGQVDEDEATLLVSEKGDAGGGHGEVEADVVDAIFLLQDQFLVKEFEEANLVALAEMGYGST